MGSRMGRSSRRVGKPRTPGWGLQAKAPRLWKDGNKGTQRTRKLSTGNARWSWRNGNRRFMDVHGERPKGLRRVRCKGAVQGCAAVRGTESLTQSREVRRETSGPSDAPEGESRRGQEHVGKAGGLRRRGLSRPARPA